MLVNAGEDMSALLRAVGRQAEEEKARILAQTEEQVRDIRANAEAEAEAMRAEAGREVKRQVRIHSERILGEVEAQERVELLKLKRKLLDETFQTARAKQRNMMTGNDYARCIAKLIEEAVAPSETRFGSLWRRATDRFAGTCWIAWALAARWTSLTNRGPLS